MTELIKMARSAKKAGLSYGQYAALHPSSPPPQPPKKEKPNKICKCCGKPFYCASRITQRKYCHEHTEPHTRRSYERNEAYEKVNTLPDAMLLPP